MGFTAKQTHALRRNVDVRQIRTREANGRELFLYRRLVCDLGSQSHFWIRCLEPRDVETRCVLARENRGTFLAVYVARVRITVHAEGATVIREGHGSGEGRGASPGEVHDIALKAAETDATKRALATFGKPFGLELYRQSRTGAALPISQPMSGAIAPTRFGFHPDDTTPIPRPSKYYGRRQSPPITEHFKEPVRPCNPAFAAAPPLAPAIPEPSPAKIDKSVLALAEPKRRRDKSHLRFVASQPCLVCGRHPSDPHHLRFAQPRALGVKVSDEFTVPLCRGHHRQLHQAGNEITWWNTLKIDALPVARQLWEQTHPNESQTEDAKSQMPDRAKQRLNADGDREDRSPQTDKTPRTAPAHEPDYGKRRSRRNAMRHGLTAETVIDVLEDPAAYRALQRAIFADYRPRSNFELQLVGRLVSLLWRLRRAIAIESGLLNIQAEILRKRKHPKVPG